MDALTLTDEAVDQLLAHPWPGNVRELENALDRAALTARDGVIRRLKLLTPAAPTQAATSPTPAPRRSRARVDEDEFRAAWATSSGDVEACADRLGITTRSVFRLRTRFGM